MKKAKKKVSKSHQKMIDSLEKQKAMISTAVKELPELSQGKKSRGAPTKYRPEFGEMLIEHMSSGLSYETFCAVAGVTRASLYQWETAHPEFLDAKEKAVAENRKFWEQLGVAGAAGRMPGFNAAAWIFNMKNRYAWTDRQDFTSKGNEIPRPQVVIMLPSNGREGENE